MSIVKVEIEAFLNLAIHHPIIDVRSPAEYKMAHIPGALNLPLFDDAERSVVGTTYKKESRENAIKVGLNYFGPKMVRMIEEIEEITRRTFAAGTDGKEDKPVPKRNKTLLVHCWRGGMRSAGVAWLLNLYGFKVYTLAGGYKSFRQWAHRQFARPYRFNILGGYTGSGKTEILHALHNRGVATIDLEGLASHKGSSFGSIGMPTQPSQEMFENQLAINLAAVAKTLDHQHPGDVGVANSNSSKSLSAELNGSENRANPFATAGETENPITELPGLTTPKPGPIWLEDESQRIGNVNIPQALWEQMRNAPVYFFNIPFEERLNHIVKGYGTGDKDSIISAIERIKKRLGGLETKTAKTFIEEGNLKESFRILLTYYDKYYLKSLHTRQNLEQLVNYIDTAVVDAQLNAVKLAAN